MSRFKKIVWALFVVFVAIQFIQPAPNKADETLPSDLEKLYRVPERVSSLLHNSCYDCHSNHTRYPWYSFIQPGAWWMASHIRQGKESLNFSKFGAYSIRRQQSKLKAMANSVHDKTMPLQSYTLVHRSAGLSAGDQTVLLGWINTIKDSLSLKNN